MLKKLTISKIGLILLDAIIDKYLPLYFQLIYLSDNQIESLPLSFGNLKNLRSLYLKYNNLKAIPDIFKTLKLSTFDLRNNPIKRT